MGIGRAVAMVSTPMATIRPPSRVPSIRWAPCSLVAPTVPPRAAPTAIGA